MLPKYLFDRNFIDNPLAFHEFELIQLGRLYGQPATQIYLHSHSDLYELTIVTNGTGKVTTNGVTTDVKRGDIYLSFPYDLHQIVSSVEDPLQFDFFAFRSKDKKYAEKLNAIVRQYAPNQRVFSDERVANLVSEAIAEFDGGDGDLLYCIFTQILIYTIRNFQTMKPQHLARNLSEHETFCYQIMHYIDTHVYTLQNLEEVAEYMKYNYSYLSAQFKKTRGSTLSAYYQQKRLATAQALIRDSSLKITQISERLNYSSLYAFSRAFKTAYHVSPREYLKMHRNAPLDEE